MVQFSFVAALVGDATSLRQCFNMAAGRAAHNDPSAAAAASLDAAAADIVVHAPDGDVISVSLRGRAALPACDVVILVCNSAIEHSVRSVHEYVGRAGSDAVALPPNTPIVLLDLASPRERQFRQQQQEQYGASEDEHSGARHLFSASSPPAPPPAVAASFLAFDEMTDDLNTVVRFAGIEYLSSSSEQQQQQQHQQQSHEHGQDQDQDQDQHSSSKFVAIIGIAANAVRCPRHVLWDGCSLTEVGRQALRRSFWLLDEDCDAALNDAEISRWHRAMYGSFSAEDVDTMKAYARNTEESYIAAGTVHARNRLISEDGRVTVLGYLAVCHIMLAEGRHEPLWVMLGAWHGVGPDALPYAQEDIDLALRCDDEESMLHLSPSGTSFFAQLYSRQRFSHPSDLFLFTPDCPWSLIYGLPNACEVDLSVHDFISCWRYMSIVDPATVARFARYWAFTGDLATLFVASKMRPFRNNSNSSSVAVPPPPSPPTAVWLVLGAPQSGKTSLMQRIADNESGTVFADDMHPSGRSSATATVRARVHNDGDMLLALRELDEVEVELVVSNTRFMNTVDGVLFCFDTSDPYSLSYLSRVHPLLAASCPDLPVVLAMCKSDLPVVDQLGFGSQGPRDFCVERGIMWPPVFTSLSHLRALPGDLLNDVDNLNFILAEVTVNPDIVRESSSSFAAAASGGGAGAGGGGGGAGAGDQQLQTGSGTGAGGNENNSNNSNSSRNVFRTLKRAVVVAAATVTAVKVGSAVWQRFELGQRFPAVDRAAGSAASAASTLWQTVWAPIEAGLAAITSSSSSASSTTTSSHYYQDHHNNSNSNNNNANTTVGAITAALVTAAATTATNSLSTPTTAVTGGGGETDGQLSSSHQSSDLQRLQALHRERMQQAIDQARGSAPVVARRPRTREAGGTSVGRRRGLAGGSADDGDEDLMFHPERFLRAENGSLPPAQHHRGLRGNNPTRMWATHSDWNEF